MRSAPLPLSATIGIALALLAAAFARADCPDAANNVPGCRIDSNAEFAAFHFHDIGGQSTFNASVGHAGPGSLQIAQTTEDFVSLQSECFDVSRPPVYTFGGYLRPGPSTSASDCQVCIWLFLGDSCAAVDGIVCAAQAGALAPGWTRFEGSTDTSFYFKAYLLVGCAMVSDGGIVRFDDAFAGTLIFFDTFESASTANWSAVVP